MYNPRYPEGMLTSIQAGIEAADATTEWFLIALADQPNVSPQVVNFLLSAAGDGPGAYIPTFEERRGHPILMHRSLRDRIAGLPPQAGLRELWRRHPDLVCHVPVDTPSILHDIDTPEDYERALQAR